MTQIPLTTKFSIALLALYTFSIGIEELITIPLAGNKIQVPEIIFLAYALSIFVNIAMVRKVAQPVYAALQQSFTKGFTEGSKLSAFRLNQLDLSVVLYFFAVALSCIVNQTRNSFGELLGITYLMGLFFLTKLLIVCNREYYPKMREIVLKSAISGAVVAILFGFLGCLLFYMDGRVQYIWFYKDYPIIGDSIRIKGTVSNPITFCSYLVSLVILLLPNESFTKKTKIGLILFLVIGVIATKTKSLILLFAIALSYFTRDQTSKFVRIGAQSIAISAIGFYLVASHFLIAPANDTRLLRNTSYGSNNIVYKNADFLVSPTAYFVLKQSAFLAFTSSPIVGVGGNELIKYSKTLFEQKKLSIDPNCAPHSTYFGALGELGLLGFAAILYLLYCTFQQIQRSPNRVIYAYLLGFIVLEMITVDLMTFRNYWLMLAFLATENYQLKP
jgi:O-Antigen ligase